MSEAKILNGRDIAERFLSSASPRVEQLKKKGAFALATVQVGTSKDTVVYSAYLSKLLSRVGVPLISRVFPEKADEATVIAEIVRLNRDESVTGVMVFSPLPNHLSRTAIFDNIALLKDVEGRTFLKSHFGVFSPTANAVMTLLESTGAVLAGKEAVVVGHSDLVGKPSAVLLMDKMATVTVCHVETRDLRRHVENADILVAAAGKAHLIRGDWIKPGAIVIDVGENLVNGLIVGDVEFESARRRASYITPVPGGVGPVTNVMLIKNLITLQELRGIRNGNR